METQTKMILHHLRTQRRITPIDALKDYGCFRLAARIHDLKDDGHHIEKQMVTCDQTGSRFAAYSLLKEATHEMAKASK